MGKPSQVSEWIVGSMATRHICNKKTLFKSLDESVEEEYVYMANSDAVKVEKRGKVSLLLSSGKILELSNVLYVPNMVKNLISVGILNVDGFSFEIGSGKMVIERHGDFVGMAFCKQGMFVLDGLAQ